MMSAWQAIGTAPQDGTRILCVCMSATKGNEEYIGYMAVDRWKAEYQGFGQFNRNNWPATHWMPLPSPPNIGDAA